MSDTRVETSGGSSHDGRLGRRSLLRGMAVGGVGVSALAACGSDDDGDETGSGSYSGQASEPTDGGGGDGGGGGGGTPLGPTSEVPVGGGAFFQDGEIVVTQPTAGEFVGFSAVCKHQGCLLDEVSDGSINCPCHGSRYDIETGEPVEGPSGADPSTITALDPAEVTVKGQQIHLV